MKKLLQAFALLLTIIGFTTIVAQGQTLTPPAFTYAGPQNYTVGTSINVLNPVNTGGVVPGVFYGQTSTLTSGFSGIFGVVADSARNIYIADVYNNLIKKITPAGVVSRFAGNGTAGFTNGTGSAATFNAPNGLAIDASGNIYVTEINNNAVRKISPYGVVTTLAGNGTAGATNGTGAAAKFNSPGGIAVDNNGNVYVSDVNNNLIRKITPAGVVSTLAGNGTYGYKDGAGTTANFASLTGITVDVAGNVYVAEGGNNVIRKITAAGVVSTLAGNPVSSGATNGTGSAASFSGPQGIAVDLSGNVYVADYYNSLIRMITPAGVVSTLAGGASGSIDGIGSTAGIQNPNGMGIDKSGTLYVFEGGNIRKVSPVGYTVNPALPAGLNFDVTTGAISGTPLLAKAAASYLITGKNAAGSGSASINITTTGTLKITAPTLAVPVITYGGAKTYTVGTAVSALSPTNTGGAIPAIPYAQTSTIAAGLGDSYGVVADAMGNIYYADNSYNLIRKVSSTGVTSVFAGNGSRGKVNGTGTAASFNNPQRMAIDAAGNIYVADMGNNLIRKITPDGIVTTFAGSGVAGRSDGIAATASFNGPAGIAIDVFGNFYVSDYNSNLIRKITSAGIVTTLAGNGAGGYADGSGSVASFSNPAGIAVDGLCNVYVADVNNHVIRKITPAGVVTTLAGSANSPGAVNGSGSNASFYSPQSVALDAAGNVYVADLYNRLVRKVTPAGVVSTLAGGGYGSSDGTGTSAGINYPEGITIDASGNLYVADGGSVRKITTAGYAINSVLPAGLTFDNTTGVISGTPLAAKAASSYSVSAYNSSGSSTTTVSITVTGTVTAPALAVQAPVIAYAGPQSYAAGTAISNLAPANTGGAVPVFAYGQTTTLATGFGNAYGIITDAAGNVYYSDAGSNVIRKITPAGVSSIFAGSGNPGFVNGVGTAASFRNPQRMGIDAAGNIYLADAGNNVIRKITPDGLVSTFAGTGVAGRNDGIAAVASFNNPAGVAVDRFGNVYVSDFGSDIIRKISTAGIVTTLAGSGSSGYVDGTGAAANFSGSAGLAVDGLCNLYVADLRNNVIRKITPNGVVTTLAGNPNSSGATNGTGSAAGFYNPQSIAADALGNIYVADEYNYQIRKITPAGVVTTLAGSGTGVTNDGIGLAARFGDPAGIAIDASGILYVADAGSVRKVSAVGYVISSAALPAGLIFDGTTGTITGTPLLAKAAANYTISAYNMGGSSTASVSIAVTGTLTAPAAVAAPVIAYSGPQSYATGTTISPLSPSNTGGAVPATIYGNTTTFAGTGTTGITDGIATAATFSQPTSTATDLYGNVYVADYNNHVIRKINANGVVTTLAGSGAAGYADGTGTAASFYYPSGVAVDASGVVYVADSYNQVIRKITPAGVVTTLAGSAGSPGYANGTGVNAVFNYPNNVAVDASKNVYVSDGNNAAIRKITAAGVVTTLAGNAGNAGYADGTGTAAMFNNPNGVAVDASGIVYVSDYSNNVIRKITAAGVVTTFAGNTLSTGYTDGTGTAANFSSPGGLAIDKAGNLYVADISNNLIRKITKTGVVSTLAGNSAAGFTNGNGGAATFYNPWGIAADYLGNIYVSDRYNNVIRKITATGYTTDNALPAGLTLDGTTGVISGKPTSPLAASVYSITAYNGGGSSTATVSITVTGTVSTTPPVAAPQIAYATPKSYPVGTAISTLSPTNTGGAIPASVYGQTTNFANTGYYSRGIAFDKLGNAYISYQNKILTITPGGVISTFAGNESSGAVNGKGSAASFSNPQGVCFDASGNLYVADNGNQVIRKVSPGGVVSNFAGVVGTTGAKNGAGTVATFNYPQQLAIDASGNVYVTDGSNNMIRKITAAGVVSTLAGNVNAGYIDGTGAAATFNNPYGITVDASGNLYVSDLNNAVIRKITPAGVVTSLAGAPGSTGNTDGAGTAASFNAPAGLTIDALGNIYVADQYNSLIRKVTSAGVVTTLAGNGTTGSTNGVGVTSSFYYPLSLALDGSGNLYLTDYNNAVRKISLNGYILAGTLPAGLTFDGTTGAISGTPVLSSAAKNYSITAYNAGGSSTATVNIAVTGTVTPPVNPVNAPVISYATPQSYTAGVGISALNPANTGGAVPAAIYARTTDFVTGSYYSRGLVTDALGNVYFTVNNQIIKATPAGITGVLAGNGSAGFVNGTGTAATFNNPQGLAVDAAGNIYVADANNNMIRKVTPAGVVTTFAGNTISERNDGPGTVAGFNAPQGVAVDIYGNVYVTDYGNNLIRKISATGVVSTLAGNSAGFANGTGTAASFSNPYGIAVDASGNVYVSDQGNAVIRKITPSGVVTTFAGSVGNGGATNGTGIAASFNLPSGLTIDAVGNIYVADQNNSLIRKITSAGVVTTLAGNSTTGSTNGVGVTSSFYYPLSVAYDNSGNLYETDYGNNVRKISLNGYTLTGTLPAGITFDGTTGAISGTPVVSSAAANYSVTAYNTGGSSTTTVNIAVTGSITPPVNPVNAPVISYATPQSYAAGVGINTLSPSNTGGAVPAKIYGQTSDFVTGSNYSHGIIADAAGNVYYTINNQIIKTTPAGVTNVLAGNGNAGFANDTGTAASFNNPQGLAIDAAGNIYVADLTNNMIRKITPAGVVTTLAGNGTYGRNDGPGSLASFNAPQSVAVDLFGNVYVADMGNHLIRKIGTSGIVSTLAGNTPGYANGTGAAALFNNPYGITTDVSGNVYVSDQGNYLIRKITPAGVVTTLAGSLGNTGAANGTGTAATFNGITGIASDAVGNIYVADQNNYLIRKITPAGVVTTLAGNGTAGSLNGIGVTASFYYPLSLAVDGSGNLYETDYNNTVRKISLNGYTLTGALPAGLTFDATTGSIVGTPLTAAAAKSYTVTAYNNGGSSTATLSIAVTGTAVAPTAPTVPVISYATPQTYAVGIPIPALAPVNTGGAVPPFIYGITGPFAGTGTNGSDGGIGATASFNNINAIATDIYGNIYTADAGGYTIRRITPAGFVTTLAGSGTPGLVNGTGVAASFSNLTGIAVDKNSNVYVTDQGNQVIRKITAAGVVTTFAGNGNYGSVNGSATVAGFANPLAITVDKSGVLYVIDNSNLVIRKITAAGAVSTFAGNGSGGFSNGTGTAASFSNMKSLAVDASGNLYVTDAGNNAIRKITTAGVVTTLAGNGSAGFADGTGTAARFSNPAGITVDAGGNIYVADEGNNLIRKITPAGVVTTISGDGNQTRADGIGQSASFVDPNYLTVDDSGNLYVADGGNTIRKISINGYTNSAPLSSGLNFEGTTGVISGTPTAASPATTYTVKGNNAAGTGTANLSITVIYPPVVTTTPPVTAFASMGDVPPVPVVIDGGITVTDLSKTVLASATISVTGNFVAGQDVLAFTPNAATMGNIAATYNATTGVLSLTSASSTATLAQWQAALQSVTYNNSNNVAPNVANRTISFTANDGLFNSALATKTVGLTYTPSSNAKLSSLSISAGTLSPAFASLTNNYTANVSNTVSSITVVPVTASANATLTVNGNTLQSGVTSAAIPLNVGDNTITTVVTAQDKATILTYTIVVTRNAAQVITFNPITTKTYGAADFAPGATSTNVTIPITYTSSNPAVATITASGNIDIVSPGTTNITASQAAGLNFDAATPVVVPLTVNPAVLTITATNQSKNYGAANPALTVGYAGFVNGDTQATLTTQPVVSTTATATSAVGTYAINASGAAAANYTISYAPGVLTINPVLLNVTAANKTKTYGAANPALTLTYSGFVNGDTQSVFTTQPTASTGAATSSAVGTYPINVSGGIAANYTVTYTSGTLTIGKAGLVIKADNQTKQYGAVNPTLTASYTGFVNNDNSFNLLTQPVLSTTATTTSAVGTYPITLSGATSNNYNITYTQGTLTVTSVALTFNPIPTQVYGASDFSPGATSSASVSYTSSNTAVATIVGGNVHIIGAGTSTITANNGTSSMSQTLSVSPAVLTITANNQSKIAGAANPALTLSYAGFVNGDTQSVLSTQPTVTTTATTASPAGSYPITVSGAAGANYSFSYVSGTLTVTSSPLTFAAIPAVTYGAADFNPGATGGSAITYTSSNLAVATIVAGNIHVVGKGTSTITATSGSSSLTQTLTVNAAALTITAVNQSKSAGAANPTLTASFTGFVNGETATVLSTQPTLTTTATTASAAGSYPITVSGAVAANYSITYVAGTLTVTAAQLTFAAIPSKVYGTADFDPGATSNSPITYTAANPVVATIVSGKIHIVGIGSTTIKAISGGTSLSQVLTVTRAPLTIAAINQTKIYGTANPALTASFSGFVNGDTVTVLTTQPTLSTTATTSSAVGSYPITVSGAVAANYTITYVAGTLTISSTPLTFAAIPSKVYGTADFDPGAMSSSSITYTAANPAVATIVSGKIHIVGVGSTTIKATAGSTSLSQVLTVTRASLTIAAINQTKIYGTANPALTASFSGFVNGDTVTVLTTQPTLSTTATTSSAVGSYPITVSGAVAANYSITYVAGTLTVTAVQLTFAAIPSKIYGTADFDAGATSNTSITYTAANPVVATIVSGKIHIVGVGSTTIKAISGGTSLSQVLTVTRAPLTIAAVNQTKTYGTANPALTASFSGFVNGDTVTVLTTQPTLSTTATTSSAVGSYPITVSGAVAANYTITYVAGTLTVSAAQLTFAAIPSKVYGTADFDPGATSNTSITYTAANPVVATIVSGKIHIVGVGSTTIKAISGGTSLSQVLTVTRAPLAIAAVNQTKTYGTANPALTASFSGFVNGDTVTVLTTQPTLSTTATTSSAVGSYPITVSGAVAANYSITYVAGTLTVTGAPLTFATIPAKTYGTADFNPGATGVSAITYTSSNPAVATIVSGNIHVIGAGSSTITATSGGSSATQTLTVNPAVITVTANGFTKIYGDVNPAFTATYAGFVNGDTQTALTTPPTLTSPATTASGVGSYAITGSAAVSNNYTFTYVNGTLAINKAALTITAADKTKVSGAANPALTVTYSGFVNGDAQAVLTTQPTITTTATTTSVAGSYPITASGAVAANYNISYVAGTLTVSAALAAPNISYTSPQSYTSGTAITALVPVNSGGAVPNAIYGQTTTFAGSGTAGSVNGTGTAASLNNPGGIAFDKSGNAYVAETGANLIRKITTAGVVTTFAGSGVAGSTNGTGTAASFNRPSGIVADASNNLYVTDAGSYLIRKITPAGVVTTLAGNGTMGSADGLATAASFGFPEQIAIDGSGNLYVADANTTIRKITPAGLVSTLPYTLQSPFGVAVDKSGNIYASDFTNQIFRLGPDGKIAIAGNGAVGAANGTGTAATFNNPNFITVDALGNIYVADSSNGLVRKITPAGVVTTLAGSGTPGSANGTGTAANFYFPFGIATDAAGNVYTTDGNQVRKIIATGYGISPALSPGLTISGAGTISGTPSSGANATNYAVTAYNTAGSSTANVNITISGQNTFQVPAISYAGPQTYPVGTAIATLTPVNTGGVIPAATYGGTTTLGTTIFDEPRGVVTDAAGNVYVAEEYSQQIRKITPAGVVSIFAGSGATGSTDGPGTSASFNDPKGIAIDASGNLYVTETGSDLIRKITPAGVVSTLAGGGSGSATNGVGAAASFSSPKGAAVDINGNVYVADEVNNMIRKITPAGVVTTFAGTGATGSANGYRTTATFSSLIGIAIDASGNLFVTDGALIRKITTDGMVSTFAGNENNPAVDGTGTAAGFGGLEGIGIDRAGNLYVADGDQVRMITPAAVVTTIAGDGNGDDKPTNGVGTAASFSSIYGVAADKLGNVYVGDTGNGLVRKITITGFAVSPALPAGLKLDAKTGAITGIPTTAAAAANYVITGYNKNGGGSTSLNIAVTQPLKFAAIPAKTYGADDFNPGATGSKPITYTSSNTAVATIVAGQIHITGAGTSTITATDSTLTLTQTLTVNKAALTITAENKIKTAGSANPSLTVSYTGFVNGDTQTVLTTQATVTTTATTASAAGSYPITASGAVAANYTITYAGGTLTVTGAAAAAPVIAYTTQSYTRGVAIASFTPTNSGGAVPASNYAQVSTFAGSGASGALNGTGTAASFQYPTGITFDSSGNMFIADYLNSAIRKVTPAGIVTTFAGDPNVQGAVNGTGALASFKNPIGISSDASGNLYVADTQNQLIRKITPAGVVTTLAGSGLQGAANGTGTAASFKLPVGTAADKNGNVYIADQANHLIRKITSAGVVTTFAGSGTAGTADGTGISASFFGPDGITIDATGNLYVADSGSKLIRKITPSAVVTTIAGNGPIQFVTPMGLTLDAGGNLYVADLNNSSIYKITPDGKITALSTPDGASITFNGPAGLNMDAAGNLFVVGFSNLIQKVTQTGYTISPSLPAGLSFDTTTGTISGTPTAVSAVKTYTVTAYNAGGSNATTFSLTVNDQLATASAPVISYAGPQTYTIGTTIAPLSPTNTGGTVPNAVFGAVTTFAGSTTSGLANGAATSARFYGPLNVANDAAGNVYVADQINSVIRKITPAGIVSVFAGSGTVGALDGTGAAASFNRPTGLAVDASGNVYIADQSNNLIRKITSAGVVTTFAGSGAQGAANGTGTAASFNLPTHIAVDKQGNLYVTDLLNSVIRKITPAGVVSTFAGSGVQGSANGTGTAASFNYPTGIAVDANGNVFVADQNNHKIRKITAAGVVTTFAGSGTAGSTNGTPTAASFYNPYAVAVDGTGNVYVADYNNNLIRLINSAGTVSTVAGKTTSGAADGTGTLATFNHPGGLSLDGAGNLYVADYANNEIRKINVTGYSINGTLPAGLAFSVGTGNITGTPTAIKATTVYAITGYNAAGSGRATLSLTVSADTASVNKKMAVTYVDSSSPTEPKVKQAMSPNGDGINDVLQIENIERYPDNKLVLIDLNGISIFEVSGYDNANKVFNGHSNKTGTMQRAGTYYYVLEYRDKGELKRKTGYFIIKY